MAKQTEELVDLTFDEDLPELQFDSKAGVEEQNIFGQLFNVGPAALRSAIQGKGFTQGAVQPSSVPTFQELSARAASDIAGNLPPGVAGPAGGALSSVAQGLGMGADIAAGTVASPFGLVPLASQLGPVRTAGSAVAQTGPAQAFGRFLTRQRRGPVQLTKDLISGPGKERSDRVDN